MDKSLRIFVAVFGLIGVGLLLGAMFLWQSTQAFLRQAKPAHGVVIEVVASHSSHDSTTWAPVVRYRAMDGEEHEFRSSMSSDPPSYAVGEAVEVFYLPSQPREARIRSFWGLHGAEFILGVIGLPFLGIGAGMYGYRRHKARTIADLKARGRPLQAELQRVEYDTTMKVNGRSPYRIIAQWHNPQTGKMHVFRSDSIWFDPTQYLGARKQISVLVDQANLKRYHIDTSFLPELAE